MRICMVLHDPQEFGGLEEYATTLAIALHEEGHAVSVLSTHWTPATNQYMRRLRRAGIVIAQPPRWLSLPASDARTKDRILHRLMWLLAPVTSVLAVALSARGRTWPQAHASAYGWLHGQVQRRLIGPDRWREIGRFLLGWWRLRWRPDVLHVQGYTTTLLFAVAWAAHAGIPVVYEEHQTPDSRFDWWQGFADTINLADIVVAVSEASAQALRTVCGVARPIVVRRPLLPDPAPTGEWQRRHAPVGAGPVQVTTVARLAVAKGLTYLCDAIALVRATHPDVQFRVYGDGDMRRELLDYAASIDLDGSEIFVGAFTNRAELARIMGDTDIFVMSSLLEGQPLGVVEAMAYGRPIVATAVGGIPELIEDGVNGLLCAPADPVCLAEQLGRLIEQPLLRRRLGQAARADYVRSPYQPAAAAASFLLVYQQARASHFHATEQRDPIQNHVRPNPASFGRKR